MVLRLEKLDLSNFKTFQKTSFSFTPGHNVVLGENGAGKSSIFEAITYGLFGSVPGKTISSLIRHDTRRMEITLEFSVDEKDFVVERSATHSTSSALLTEKNGKRIAEKAKAVNEEMGQILGLGQRVFSNVVYIPQGQIAAIASERPSERRELFDKILGYYLYKITSDRLRVVERSTDQSITAFHDRIRDFQEDIKRKNEIETDLESLELKLNTLQKDIIDLKPKLEKAVEKYEELNNERETINQIEERLKSKEQEIEKRKNESKDLIISLEELTKKSIPSDIKEVKELKTENTMKLSHLEESLKKLDLKVEEGKNVRSVLSELTKRKASLESQIDTINTKISNLAHEIGVKSQNYQKELTTIKTRSEQLKESKIVIKRRIDEVILKEKELSVLEEKKNTILEDSEGISVKKKDLEATLSSILPDWRTSLEEILNVDLSVLKIKQEKLLQNQNLKNTTIQGKITSLQDQVENESKLLSLIKTKNIENCPLCEQSLNDSHRKNIKATKRTKIKEIRQEIKKLTKEKQLNDLAIKKSIDSLEDINKREKNQISLQLHAKELKDFQSTIKDLKKNLGRVESSIEDLKDPSKIYNELEIELEKIESDQNILGDRINRIENILILSEQLGNFRSEMDSIIKEVSNNQKNFNYLELEENIKVLKYQKQDQKHILNIIPRLETLISTHDSIEQLIEEQITIKLDLSSKLDEFDEKTFRKFKNRVEKLKTKKVQIETNISSLVKDQIPDKKKSLREIREKEKKLKSIKHDLKITQSKLDTIEIVRNFTKEIVPILRRQHVMAISEYSTEIFSYLMNNEEYEGIEITEDYELLILQSGKKYDLTILSGGEQVIACLAIRLAIAKLLANQDIMLLDEPTVMLDSYRRKELVEVFDKTKPVRQTIIVTHDTEFERVADTTFTIVKLAGRSTVISEEIDHIVSQQKKYQMLTKERFKQLEIS